MAFQQTDTVQMLLPIAFLANYAKVQSIVDCFEIEIEEPSDPEKQALTWSEYKKCNTMKYLISCSPVGVVNFILIGYGGRTSDIFVFEKCGIIDKVPSNCVVMADRGFKQIASLLKKKNCQLIRPPSVSGSKQCFFRTSFLCLLRIIISRCCCCNRRSIN